MLSEQSNILTSTEKPTTSKADPADRGPDRTQARLPQVSCDIGPQYGIISTLKIPAVYSASRGRCHSGISSGLAQHKSRVLLPPTLCSINPLKILETLYTKFLSS